MMMLTCTHFVTKDDVTMMMLTCTHFITKDDVTMMKMTCTHFISGPLQQVLQLLLLLPQLVHLLLHRHTQRLKNCLHFQA